jgi:deazaflavin-dependent oxidoreductase (nitroreductase family)
MSLRRRLAHLNRVFGNRVVGRIIPLLPGFGAVYHRGRKSGRAYRTPVKVFRRGDSYVISLPYGSNSDWVKNVLAAGSCDIITRRQRVHLVDPKVYRDEKQAEIPAFLRVALKAVNATEFITLKSAEATSPRP